MDITDGVDEAALRCKKERRLDGLLADIYSTVHSNWTKREPNRWPSPKNWQLRVAPDVTFQANRNFEKQLQKAIVNCLQHEGWGNDVSTSSGLVNSQNRQMNIDLAHRINGGFEFIELKLSSNNPWQASVQATRYLALYMLYRLEPELRQRFPGNEMLTAKRVRFEILAPDAFYLRDRNELPLLEQQINAGIEAFCEQHSIDAAVSFHFRAFPREFFYQPGMDCSLISSAMSNRVSPLSNLAKGIGPSNCNQMTDQTWLEGFIRLPFSQKLAVIGASIVFAVWFWIQLGHVIR